MTSPQNIYIQCNPLLDISAEVDDAFFSKYNVEKNSASLVSEEQMGIYADIAAQPGVVYIPGGSGLNTARVAQWIAQAAQGQLVSYVGCAADDAYGKELRQAAEKDGVKMVLEWTTKAPTGTCAVCVSKTERALVTNLAAANCLSAEHMKSAAVLDALAAAKLFYVTGYTLTIDVNYVIQIAEAARAAGGKFLLNLSAPFIVQFFTENLNKVIPYADIIFGNEDEARALSKVMSWGTDDVEEIAKKTLTDLPYSGTAGRLVVYTQGSGPACFVSADGHSEFVEVTPIEVSKIVDTNGAGDAFVGGFLAAYAMGRPVRRCCEVGNYAAGIIIQHDGCTYPAKPSMSP